MAAALALASQQEPAAWAAAVEPQQGLVVGVSPVSGRVVSAGRAGLPQQEPEAVAGWSVDPTA
ncbi:hypothetical protein ACN26Z_16250 [Verrucosispora sp. WMMD703]|uniref:Uncharacterized protein n=1 Tax=Micromonospora sediminimaris TaxID=547162 RepID=A0A9W5ULM8_9ACTN|nr:MULTISPECIES: hypothetical protein [Micromonospora]WFE43023.1 hypothetical protein O7624_01215 [Verrucosispora sp. WMMD1129]GIJ31107.1 hypothetical protein Vse01_02550 [Micromonospora sediminimaris]